VEKKEYPKVVPPKIGLERKVRNGQTQLRGSCLSFESRKRSYSGEFYFFEVARLPRRSTPRFKALRTWNVSDRASRAMRGFAARFMLGFAARFEATVAFRVGRHARVDARQSHRTYSRVLEAPCTGAHQQTRTERNHMIGTAQWLENVRSEISAQVKIPTPSIDKELYFPPMLASQINVGEVHPKKAKTLENAFRTWLGNNVGLPQATNAARKHLQRVRPGLCFKVLGGSSGIHIPFFLSTFKTLGIMTGCRNYGGFGIPEALN